MVKKENDSLNTLWAHSEGMPKIWQHLKNMNDSLTDSLSNMHPRDASASKKEGNICSVEEEWKGEIFDPKRYFVVTEKKEEENIWKQDLQQWEILSHR